MSFRISTILLMILALACESPYNHSPAKTADPANSGEAIRKREQISFKSFLDQLSIQAVFSPTHELQKRASQYFPDSTIHLDHQLHVQVIPFKDSINLVYYEYSQESSQSGFTYLGIFNKEGEALDVLKIKEVSYDGSITVNLIDNKILEIEYYDFFRSKHFFKNEIYTDKSGAPVQTPFWVKTSFRSESEKDIIDYYYFENYLIETNGSLRLLDHPKEVISGRQYPFVSLRVLSFSELEMYNAKELREMINEIYASYGFIFRNKQLLKKYQGRNWYQALHSNVDSLLTDVEKLNIKKLAAAEIKRGLPE